MSVAGKSCRRADCPGRFQRRAVIHPLPLSASLFLHDVPALVCDACEDVLVSAEVARWIEARGQEGATATPGRTPTRHVRFRGSDHPGEVMEKSAVTAATSAGENCYSRRSPIFGASAFEISGFDSGGHVREDMPPPEVLVDWLFSGRFIDGEVSLHPRFGMMPWLSLWHQEGWGGSVQIEDEASPSVYLSADVDSGSRVQVTIPPGITEHWPDTLFLPPGTVVRAVDHFLETGRPDPSFRWLPSNGFPREASDQED